MDASSMDVGGGMNTIPMNFTVADYCEAMQHAQIVVNRDYQRSAKVWPPVAKSFLIETILLGLPMPKLYLCQKIDPASRKSFKEIIDGQQRSMAVLDFYENKLRVSSGIETERLAGRTYSELEEAEQRAFLDYRIGADLFTNATEDEVRNIFRRMNSYTIPLNPEEQRHATYQGPFKWFVLRLAKQFDDSLIAMGVFTKNKIVRMADAKLLTEMCHALANGIQTTKKIQLDTVYKSRDKHFPEERDWEERISEALDQLNEWKPLHGGSLMRPHVVYSLILAIMHVRASVPSMAGLFASPTLDRVPEEQALSNLSMLAEALENPDEAGDLIDFVDACSKKTNTASQRRTRFTWCCKALAGEL